MANTMTDEDGSVIVCTCVPGEGCDQEGDPGCRYCQIIDPELPCPTEDDADDPRSNGYITWGEA